jgi:CRISPR system Cascade subunit CasA
LAGETETQDVAVLRLLLAVLQTMFSRVDEVGNAALITERREALRRWQAIWKLGQLPQQPIEDYLTQWRERFWLFDPEYPFFQTEEAKRRKPKRYNVAKMNGELVESANKRRLFPSRTGEGKKTLSYAEAARWLLYLNGWDDVALKPSDIAKRNENRNSASIGWLGKLGYIEVVGDSLFETLLLNLTLLRDGVELWNPEDCKPSWEEEPSQRELTQIPVPNHPAALLTMQYRRVKLEAENGKVCHFYVYSGDLISPTNAFAEQNTIWRLTKGKGGEPDAWVPRNHDPARQLWRDFSSIASQNDSSRTPGVVQWIAALMQNRILSKDWQMRLRIVTNCYNDNPTSRAVEDLFSDQLTLYANLLTELGERWRKRIEEEIKACDNGAKACGRLAKELNMAAGGNGEGSVEQGKAMFYDAIDRPFRDWLSGLSAQQSRVEMVKQCDIWRQTAQAIGLRLGKQMVDEAGPAAFVGRFVEEKEEKSKKNQGIGRVYYAAPDSYRKYELQIRKIFNKKEGNEG